jgi:hypothetical protein
MSPRAQKVLWGDELATFELLRPHIPGEAESTQDRDSIQFGSNSYPGHAMTSQLRISVMVVVPDLTKRQKRHPKAFPGIIAGVKALSSPHMRGGVDQPAGVEPDYGTEENAPQNVTPPAHGKKQTGHIVIGTQCQRLIHLWNRSLRSSGT